MSGNIFLDKWYGAGNSLYFLALLYGLLGTIFGYSYELLWIVSAVLWACLVVLAFWIVLELYIEKPHACAARLCFTFISCFSSCFFLQERKIFTGAHFDVIIIGILYLWVVSREIELCKNYTPQLILSSVLLLLALWSDNLTKVFIVLPAFVGLIFNLIFVPAQKVKKKYIIKHLTLCVALLVGSKVILKLMQNHIGMIVSFPPNGVDVSDWTSLFPNIAYFMKTALYVFGCDIFGQHIGANSIILIFRVLVLIVLLFGLGLSLKKIVRNIFNQFILLCIGVETLIVVLTQQGGDTLLGPSWTSRLMYCAFISFVLLFAQIDWGRIASLVRIENKKVVLGCGMAAMLLLMVFNLSILRTGREQNPDGHFDEIADALVERGLTRGYGTFWLASSVTVASEFQTDVRPIIGQDLTAYHWLSKDTSDWKYADFVLFDKSMWGEVTEESIIDSIGDPAEKVQVGETTILIWDKNILPYVNGSGYPGETLDAWWSLEEGQAEKVIEATSNHFFSDFVAGENGYYMSDGEGWLLYGPSKSLKDGVYNITFEYDYVGTMEPGDFLGQVDVKSNAQKVEYVSKPAIAGVNSVTLENVKVLPECTDLETRFYANVEGITVRRIVIRRAEI